MMKENIGIKNDNLIVDNLKMKIYRRYSIIYALLILSFLLNIIYVNPSYEFEIQIEYKMGVLPKKINFIGKIFS